MAENTPKFEAGQKVQTDDNRVGIIEASETMSGEIYGVRIEGETDLQWYTESELIDNVQYENVASAACRHGNYSDDCEICQRNEELFSSIQSEMSSAKYRQWVIGNLLKVLPS